MLIKLPRTLKRTSPPVPPPSPFRPVLQLENISKFFGQSAALKDISLKIEKGKFYALLGKNGAGKSTLMRIVMRHEVPDQGKGLIFNHPLDGDAGDINFEVGYVSETIDYQLPLSIQKLFSYFSKIYPKWNQTVFDDFLSRLQIDKKKMFSELSRGQKMQVAFSAAVAIQPKLILLDEITSVLDANARFTFMKYLHQFTKVGGTVVMATNIVSEVQHYADHLILIDEGRIKLDLAMSEISKKFTKLRKQTDENHDVFSDSNCIEVSANSDKSTSYLIPTLDLEKYSVSKEDSEKFLEKLKDKRGITAEELFNYYTRFQSGGGG